MATVKLDPAKGIQIPNLTTTERNAISSPETGAIIWNTTTSEINQYNGSAWGTVGISEDTTKLPLAGGTLTGNTTIATNSTPKLILKRTGNNAGNGYIECHGADDSVDYKIAFAQSNGVMSFDVGGTRMLGVTSDGLCFNSDTTSANALDDYEEGTWTPVFKGSTGSAGSWASSTFTSTYTKIGRTVHIACAGYLTNVGSWTGNAIITGLPFASSFGEHSPLSMAGFPNTTTYGTGAGSQPLITCYVGAAGSQINFKSGAGQDPACPYSIVRTGYYVQVSGTYTAT